MNATFQRFNWAVLCVALATGGGCQHSRAPMAAAVSSQQAIRNNCLSLLLDLLNQEKNVDKLLLVKLESSEVHGLIKAIASASAAAAEHIESFARGDRSIVLDQLSLPSGEIATRQAIAHTTTKELLKPFNPAFEFELLLTQAQALSYAWHLANVAAKHEVNADRAAYLSGLGEQMKELRQQSIPLMRTRRTAQANPE